MRILVTRPGEDGVALAEILGAHGIESVIEPLLTIKQIEGAAIELKDIQAILLTSANGVRALARRTDRRDIPVFAVGDATATTAKSSGFNQVHSAAGNVETLAALVTEMLKPEAGPLLHVAGSSVAGDLIGMIEAAGFKCTRKVLYEAVAERSLMTSTIAAIKDNHINAVTLYSPRSAEIFVELIRKARLIRSCQKITAICLSQAVVEKIDELHWQDVLVAPEPNQDSLLELIVALNNNLKASDGATIIPAGIPTGGPKDKVDQNVASKEPSETSPKTSPKTSPGASITTNVLHPQQRPSSTSRTVLVTLLVIIILAGMAAASKSLWLPKLSAFAPALFAASETEVKITNLSGRLKAIEDSQLVPDLATLQQERKRLQTKLDVTLKRLDVLENSIGSVKQMIEAVNTDSGSGAAQTLQRLANRLQILEKENSSRYQSKDGKTLDTLIEDVAALKKTVPSVVGNSQSSAARAMVLSIGQLREAVRAGRSFDIELAAFTTLIDKNELIKAALKPALNQLATIAEAGAPSLEILRAQFDYQAGKIVQAGLMPTEGGWLQRTLGRLTESVKWRRTDNLAGNGVEAIVARAERALKSRDVEKTIKELSALAEKPAAVTKSWLAGAKAYMVAEKALAELQTRAVAHMAAGQ